MKERGKFMEQQEFKCILCGAIGEPVKTGKKPRDRDELDIVDCPVCGHRQLFPLLSEEELKEEYDLDKSVRSGKIAISGGVGL